MLTLLGSLLGFGTSFLPSVMDFFKRKQDNAQELALMKEQRETTLAIGAQKMQMVEVDASIREVEAVHKEQSDTIKRAAKWLANLSGSVRPVVTYAFVIEFLAINAAVAVLLIQNGGFNLETIGAVKEQILDEEFKALLATMIAFWFGNRTFGKRVS